MPEHDIVEEQDGWVLCRCDWSFSDNTTEEARARHRVHWRAETIDKPGLESARQALQEGRGEPDSAAGTPSVPTSPIRPTPSETQPEEQ